MVPLSPAMWNAPFYWPMHDVLALTEHEAAIGLIGSPIQWLGGSPLLAYNLILIASAWWSALATHALVRRLTRNAAAAWCAGLIWGFAPYRASQLAHLQLLVAWWMPVALLALHAYYEEGRFRWLVVFGVAWLLQATSNGYYMFFFPVLVGGWIAVFTRWPSEWRRAGAVFGAWAIASLPLAPVLLEYYRVQRALNLFRTREEMQAYSATWASFARCPLLLRFWPFHDAKSQEDFLFPGVAALTAIALAVLVRRRAALTRPLVFYTCAAAGLAWMAAGPSPRQWSIASLWHVYDLVAWLPGYSGLRVPERFFMLSTLCLAIAGGLAVASFGSGRRQTPVVALLVGALALIDGWIVAMPLGVPPRPFGIASIRGAHVLELPMDDEAVNVAAMYRETLHGMPVVNGYAGYIPPHAGVIEWALRRGDPSVLSELRRGHPLFVVVSNHPSSRAWTTLMEEQHDAQMLGISGAGRLYLMPATPFPPQVTIGAALGVVGRNGSGGWLTVDLGEIRTVRAVELRTRGHVTLVEANLRADISLDGVTWTTVADEPPGALALAGALRAPLDVPLRLLLPDLSARFLRLNTPAFGPEAMTVFGP